jgi:hypothetical protein
MHSNFGTPVPGIMGSDYRMPRPRGLANGASPNNLILLDMPFCNKVVNAQFPHLEGASFELSHAIIGYP